MTDQPDAEQYAIEPVRHGGPVDPPPEPRTLYGTITGLADQRRPPIVPAWMRNGEQRRSVARQGASAAGYHTARHLTRTPKYVALAAWYAPRGAWRALAIPVRWARAEEGNWHLRQEAANRNDPHTWLTLDARRQRQSSWRWPLLLAVAGIVAACLAAAAALIPAGPWLLSAAALAVFARLGRPADRPIIDHTTVGQRFTKLTAEQVRNAVVAAGVGVKDPGHITFPPPGIHRDGPGWLARFNLPAGVRAVKLLEGREALSSALRLPVDQIWPSIGPDHAGQVDLWVGYAPSSKMGRAKWTLVSPAARTSVFEPIPFGHDERMRAVTVVFFQRNFLIGGQPGAGKTSGGRALVLGALLDPTVEMWLAAFKPAEDFYDVSPFCARYVCGIDDATMEEAGRMVADGLREVQRRQTLLGKLKREGKIAEGKTSPELAAAGIGLHPLFLVFDEVHELFLWSKEVADALIRLVKQGRSAGVIVVLLTQVAGKDSVPPELTRCVSSRWCMSVADQVANDQIMGTGAYKTGRSGTTFRPEVDAGWGITDGMVGIYRGPARAYWPNEEELAVMLERIRMVRGAGTPSTTGEHVKARDMLSDGRAVLRDGESGLPWAVLAQRLAELAPEYYAGITADMVRESLARFDVPSQDVKVAGRNVKGARRSALDTAQNGREIES